MQYNRNNIIVLIPHRILQTAYWLLISLLYYKKKCFEKISLPQNNSISRS